MTVEDRVFVVGKDLARGACSGTEFGFKVKVTAEGVVAGTSKIAGAWNRSKHIEYNDALESRRSDAELIAKLYLAGNTSRRVLAIIFSGIVHLVHARVDDFMVRPIAKYKLGQGHRVDARWEFI